MKKPSLTTVTSEKCGHATAKVDYQIMHMVNIVAKVDKH